jgi:hypothetical protein
MFQMFQLLQSYVAAVVSYCCKCFIRAFYVVRPVGEPGAGGQDAWLPGGSSGRRRWGRRTRVLWSGEALGRAHRARGAVRRRSWRAARRAGGARLTEGLADWAGGALGACAWDGAKADAGRLSGRPAARGTPDVRALDIPMEEGTVRACSHSGPSALKTTFR